MEAKTIYQVITKLIGPINPQGETNTDNERFENIKVMTEVTEMLIRDIDDVAYKNKDRQEYSMKRAGEHASKWMDKHCAE